MTEFKDFVLKNHKNEDVSLSDCLNSHNVLLFFYRGMFWGTWGKQLSQVGERKSEIYQQYNTVIFAISSDSVNKCRALHKKLGLNFELLSDEDLEVIKAYDMLDPNKKVELDKYVAMGGSVIIKKGGEVAYYDKSVYNERPSIDDLINELKKI